MNLENLKTGMVLEFENNEYAMVLLNTTNGDIYSGRIRWGSIYELDFKNNEDVVRVWQPLDNMSYFLGRNKINSGDFTSNSWELVWERPVVKEMTLEEIEKELGYKIKIVKEETKVPTCLWEGLL